MSGNINLVKCNCLFKVISHSIIFMHYTFVHNYYIINAVYYFLYLYSCKDIITHKGLSSLYPCDRYVTKRE